MEYKKLWGLTRHLPGSPKRLSSICKCVQTARASQSLDACHLSLLLSSPPLGPRARSAVTWLARPFHSCRPRQVASRPNERFRPRGVARSFNAHRQHRLHRRPWRWGPFPSGTLSHHPRSPAPLTPQLLPLPRRTHTLRCSLAVPVPVLGSALPLPLPQSRAPTYPFRRYPLLSRLQPRRASTSKGSSQVSSISMTASVSRWVIVSPHSIFTSVQSVAYWHQ